MELIFITNDPYQATLMASAGVDRIMVDLEINGKLQRQGHLDTVISRHSNDDIGLIRSALDQCSVGSLMVRINPIFTGSKEEIDDVIALGADRIMLPMFTHPSEVSLCLDYINGRVPLTLLLETTAALARLPQILCIKGLDDFHIGLNDLHLDIGLDFMFELFASGLLDHAANYIKSAGFCFGIGGVGCIGTGLLPAELILGAHLHLGSERVILSRSFANSIKEGRSVDVEIQRLRAYLSRTDLDLIAIRRDLSAKALRIANGKYLHKAQSL